MSNRRIYCVLAAVVLFVSILVGFSSCDYNTPLYKKYADTVWLARVSEKESLALVFTDNGICTILAVDKELRVIFTNLRTTYRIKRGKLHIDGVPVEEGDGSVTIFNEYGSSWTCEYSVIKPKDLKPGN